MEFGQRHWLKYGFVALLFWIGVSVILFFQYFYSIFFVQDLGTSIKPFLFFKLPNLLIVALSGIVTFLAGAFIGLLFDLIRMWRKKE
ncbi:hypothetical protein HZB00_04105 [Candidatus Woesearchaeota archaeon]|nr:hypothetical protein [Candidatus Woesearchaeota archaeon]